MTILSAQSLGVERVLVVAPHPDDESLGCGGLIWTLARCGARFHVVFVTDGGASHPRSRLWPRARLAEEREREAAEALRRLGIGAAPRTFLRLPDADMPAADAPAFHQAVGRMAEIVGAFRPDLVLLPWRRDPHRDHRDAWKIAGKALASEASGAAVWEYAIWLDELGSPEDHPRPGEAERIDLDVAPALGAKRHAIEAHVSQVTNLIADDPGAFRLTQATIERLTGTRETYWRPIP